MVEALQTAALILIIISKPIHHLGNERREATLEIRTKYNQTVWPPLIINPE